MSRDFAAQPDLYRAGRGLAIIGLALAALTGCGESKPTDRVPGYTENDPSILRTVRTFSPVRVEDVTFHYYSMANGEKLGSAKLSAGHQADFALDLNGPIKNTQRTLLVEMVPNGPQSRYYDPIADQMLPLTTTLHAVVLVPQVSNMGTGLDVTVTPFSELAFQRALARIGAPDSSLASLKALDLGSLQVAQNEALTVFQVRANDPSVLLSQSGSLAQINLGLNGAANYAQSLMNIAMSLGHILLAQQRVGPLAHPWMDYAAAVQADFSDGDLDGRALAGQGDSGPFKRLLSRSVLGSAAPENTDATQNSYAALSSLQYPARNAYHVALGQAVQAFLLPRLNPAAASYLQQFSFANLSQPSSDPVVLMQGYDFHAAGAGNYTPAFGLPGTTVFKQAIGLTNPGTPPVRLDGLAGTYTNPAGCTLHITETGQVTLSQGSTRLQTSLNREILDSLKRPDAQSSQYILNVGTPRTPVPTFVQIQTLSTQILTASAGDSTETSPDALANPMLSCTFS